MLLPAPDGSALYIPTVKFVRVLPEKYGRPGAIEVMAHPYKMFLIQCKTLAQAVEFAETVSQICALGIANEVYQRSICPKCHHVLPVFEDTLGYSELRCTACGYLVWCGMTD